MAIVPARDAFVGLFCTESPEVLFEDTMMIRLTGEVTECPVDVTFRDVCEPGSLRVIGFSTPVPALIGIELQEGMLRIAVEGKCPPSIVVRVSGVRRGRSGLRFPRHTREQMVRNNQFWEQAR